MRAKPGLHAIGRVADILKRAPSGIGPSIVDYAAVANARTYIHQLEANTARALMALERDRATADRLGHPVPCLAEIASTLRMTPAEYLAITSTQGEDQ